MAGEQRAQTLVDQVDDATGRLLANQLKLVQKASNKDKSLATLAAETTSIEAYTAGMVRAVEDMLVITRHLKECWVLGQRFEPGESKISEQERVEVEERLRATLGDFAKALPE